MTSPNHLPCPTDFLKYSSLCSVYVCVCLSFSPHSYLFLSFPHHEFPSLLKVVQISLICMDACLFSPSIDHGEGNGIPLQYSCLENPMDRGAWLAALHGVAKSQIRLSDFTFTLHFHALEKEMATHSSVLAWRIPGTGEPGGLPSMGSHRVRHD